MALRKAKNRGMLRPRQKFGKFRVVHRIAQGGFADVYRAYDTVEGIHVALLAGLASGALKPVVGLRIPLKNAARAHEKVLEAGSYGKIILIP